MAPVVYKWFLASIFLPLFHFERVGSNEIMAFSHADRAMHPYYISVVEINHNASEKTLEISCKIFTNDFETTLEKNYKTKVDLVNPPDKGAMDKIVSDYISKHLSFKIDNKPVNFSYVGFEKQDEAIYCYFQVDNITSLKKIDIVNSILHDFSDQQINIIHCTVGGKRQSTKLDYPKTEVTLEF